MGGLTDFNDLHVVAGLNEVQRQLLACLQSPAPSIEQAAADVDAPAPEAAEPPAPEVGQVQAWTIEKVVQRFLLIEGETKVWDSHRLEAMKSAAFAALVGPALAKEWKDSPAKRVVTRDDVAHLAAERGARGVARDLVDRYIYLEGTTQVWDTVVRDIKPQGALKMELSGNYSIWESHPQRRSIEFKNLVFDPTQKLGPPTHINKFLGLRSKPRADAELVEPIRILVLWLCNGDAEIADWVIKWLAYPIQHLGAKMRTALLFHGREQGAGKSLLFAGIHRHIYGPEHSTVVGQHQLEGQYSDWKSRVLFCVFEEIFSNATKYGNMGLVKHMITGETQRIEKKFVSGWEEANHMNTVFLSNENQPLPIEPNDRRLLVVWPKKKLVASLKAEVTAALENGGVAAWHQYLLDYPLGDFTEFTEPPMTEDKKRLIEYGLPSWEAFHREWKAGSLEYPYTSCLVEQLYTAYKRWCRGANEHALPRNKFSTNVATVERRRPDINYLRGQSRTKGRLFLIGAAPEGKSQEVWLGDCVTAFAQALAGGDDE